jgi:phosphocarrier protein HPr
MVIIDVEVLNELGIHARTAAKLVRTAAKYQSDMNAIKNGKAYGLKRAVSVMLMNAKRGDQFKIEIAGTDEQDAAKEITGLFADRFGEK